VAPWLTQVWQIGPPEVVPDAEVIERPSSSLATSAIGNQRGYYEPWPVVPVGTTEVLDDLPKKYAKEKVRAVAAEIAEFEGPIHVDRLASLTAASFGQNRLHEKKRQQIIRHIKATDLMVDADGFVWPSDVDQATWVEFRPNDSKAEREFLQISPVEIANAARFIQARHPEYSPKELEAATLQTFGRKRRTRDVAAHLAKASALLTANRSNP